MRQISTGKAAENERKYPYNGKGLDIGLNRRIMTFHNARHIQPRHGRSAISKGGEGEAYYRWCFSDLEIARSFVEQFGGTIHPNIIVGRDEARRIAANIAKLPGLLARRRET
jgi:hypothetical protein